MLEIDGVFLPDLFSLLPVLTGLSTQPGQLLLPGSAAPVGRALHRYPLMPAQVN